MQTCYKQPIFFLFTEYKLISINVSINYNKTQDKLKYFPIYTLLSMANIQNTNNTKCCWGCGTIGALILVRLQNGSTTLEDILEVSNTLPPRDPAIMLIRIYPKMLESCLGKNLHTNIYSSFILNYPNLEAIKMLCNR